MIIIKPISGPATNHTSLSETSTKFGKHLPYIIIHQLRVNKSQLAPSADAPRPLIPELGDIQKMFAK